jgi:hypothetical protein
LNKTKDLKGKTLKQFTITYRDGFGAKFAVIDADSADSAKRQVLGISPDAAILTVRENNPPLATIAGVR